MSSDFTLIRAVLRQGFFTFFTRGRLTVPSPRKTSLVFPLKNKFPLRYNSIFQYRENVTQLKAFQQKNHER